MQLSCTSSTPVLQKPLWFGGVVGDEVVVWMEPATEPEKIETTNPNIYLHTHQPTNGSSKGIQLCMLDHYFEFAIRSRALNFLFFELCLL